LNIVFRKYIYLFKGLLSILIQVANQLSFHFFFSVHRIRSVAKSLLVETRSSALLASN